MTRQEAVKWAKAKKTTVVGMVERGGRIHATLAENREQLPVRSIVERAPGRHATDSLRLQ